MSIANLTPSQLRAAADLQEKIAQLQTELAAILGGEAKIAPAAASKPTNSGKRKFSAAHIAKIKAAQKARWAKFHAAKAAKPSKK